MSAEGPSPSKPLVSVITVVFNRPLPLEATIASVVNQTYDAIEHVVVDGGSTDGTVDIIKKHEAHIAKWISEPDYGIYDALNKAIALSTGQFICILHAGDRFEADFIERAIQHIDGDDTIPYAGFCHDGKAIAPGKMNDGVYFHYLGINISTFLVPRAVYSKIGLFDREPRIISDMTWMRKAHGAGIRFKKFDGFPLLFAPDGASSAKTEAERRALIDESNASYRIFFPFLPEDICEAIYLYRFQEWLSFRILTYISTTPLTPSSHPQYALFLSALKSMLQYLWQQRPIDCTASKESDERGEIRLRLAERLGLPSDATNVTSSTMSVATLADEARGLRRKIGATPVVLHYLEVFSRPSETFIFDLVNRLEKEDSRKHVILCDTRVEEAERPFENIFVFGFDKHPIAFAKRALREFMKELDPKLFVFHFCINGWRLLRRLDAKYTNLPAIYMAHGIDIFALKKESEYSKFIKHIASNLPTSKFTTVSNYLLSAMVDAGIPKDKIEIVPNCVNPKFFETRRPGKLKGARSGSRSSELRLLNMGRLIPLKGHDVIIRALGHLKNIHRLHARLTIACGGEQSELSNLQSLASECGVTDVIDFRRSVNFAEVEQLYAEHDILISSSRYSNGRSEAFGMSILEGIAAGMPVVITNAGGQTEATGPAGRFARIVPPDDSLALADAIHELVSSGALNDDNIDYARERVELFSDAGQLKKIRNLIDRLLVPLTRITILTSAVENGAGYSALRVHKGLLDIGAKSHLIAHYKPKTKPQIPNKEYLDQYPTYSRDDVQPTGPFLRPNKTIFSVDTDGLPDHVVDRIIDESDVISIHWYARFLSNDNIARFTQSGKPVVFTIRDMHPLTGGCHYFHGCNNWQYACYPCPQFLPEDVHLPQATLAYKLRHWDMSNVTVVVLSEHTKHIVKESPLFGACRIQKISNSIDTDIFYPRNKENARQAFDIPPDKKVIAFIPSSTSTVKGKSEAISAINRLSKVIAPENIVLLCAGHTDGYIHPKIQTIPVGYIHDRKRLAEFYSAADVTLVPSLEETFSNTAAESIACGTPVAGFATGAVADLAQKPRGMTVAPGDASGLAQITAEILSWTPDAEDYHAHIVANHSMEGVGRRYAQLFEELVAQSARRHNTSDEYPLNSAAAFYPEAKAYSEYLTGRLRWATFTGDRSAIKMITNSNQLNHPPKPAKRPAPAIAPPAAASVNAAAPVAVAVPVKKEKPKTVFRTIGRAIRTVSRAVRSKINSPELRR